MEFEDNDIEELLAQYKERAIGPTTISIMGMAGIGVVPVFGVNETSEIDRLYAHGKRKGVFDQGVSFAILKTDDIHVVLTIDWPEINTEIVLLFRYETYKTTLNLIIDNGGTLAISKSSRFSDFIFIEDTPLDSLNLLRTAFPR